VTLDRIIADGRIVGMPASPGIVIGPVHLLIWEVPDVPLVEVSDEAIPAEVERFQKAVEKAKQRLSQVKARAERHAGPEEAAIFDVQISILSDAELIQKVEGLIHQNIAAEKAFDLVMIEWRTHFARHAQPMIRERVSDLTDIHIRVLTDVVPLRFAELAANHFLEQVEDDAFHPSSGA